MKTIELTKTYYLFNGTTELYEFEITGDNATIRRLSVKDRGISNLDRQSVRKRVYTTAKARQVYVNVQSQAFNRCIVIGSMIQD